MDYIDQLKQFAARVEQLCPSIGTEEATKTALILPFFQMLGYDVFNPLEFVPEFTADVGIKKGEKVDYAIVLDGSPAILIEAKWCGENLDEHSSQLFRYFGTTAAKIGILTNGIIYRFYTDLDEPNKMDLTPFMEVNVLDIKENIVAELKRFHRDQLDLNTVFNAASELKYSTAIKQFLAEQTNAPSDDFINFVVSHVYNGRKTSNVLEKFKPIVKRSFAQYLNDVMNDRFKSMLNASEDDKAKVEEKTDEDAASETDVSPINTTADEIEAFIIIKALLHDVVDASRLYYKDTQSYFGVLLDNKVNRWICRLQMDGRKKNIIIHTSAEGKDEKIVLNGTNDLYRLKDKLQDALKLLI